MINTEHYPQQMSHRCFICGEQWFMTHVCPLRETKTVLPKPGADYGNSMYNIALDNAAAVIAKELIENPKTQYQEQYNDGIKSLINKILFLKK